MIIQWNQMWYYDLEESTVTDNRHPPATRKSMFSIQRRNWWQFFSELQKSFLPVQIIPYHRLSIVFNKDTRKCGTSINPRRKTLGWNIQGFVGSFDTNRLEHKKTNKKKTAILVEYKIEEKGLNWTIVCSFHTKIGGKEEKVTYWTLNLRGFGSWRRLQSSQLLLVRLV